jgi:hypothetical protein
MSPGVKHDGGKLRWDLLPTKAVREVVRVLTHGAQKYAPGNWKHVPGARWRYYRAARGHMEDWWDEDMPNEDSESKISHLAHAICCLLFLLWFELTGRWPEEKPDED